eukprot:365934-Chlamydomonas_euryale.AAC.5
MPVIMRVLKLLNQSTLALLTVRACKHLKDQKAGIHPQKTNEPGVCPQKTTKPGVHRSAAGLHNLRLGGRRL